MILQRVSVLTGKINEMEIPVTMDELDQWIDSGELIQNFFPELTPDQREFLLTGATPEEWETLNTDNELA